MIKKLDLLLLKAYIPPFLASFAIAIFILVNQYLYWFLSAFAGKGLPLKYLGELFLYAGGRLIIIALPVAILTGAVITFGNLAERNELMAIKSSGISFWRLLRPFFGLGLVFVGFSIWQSFEIIPYSSTKLYTLLYDVKQKKADLVISPGKFYSDIEGYVIRVGDKDSEKNTLYDLLVYKRENGRKKQTIIRADSGKIVLGADQNFMKMTFYSGLQMEEIPPEEIGHSSTEDTIDHLGRMYFDSLYTFFPLDGFGLGNTSPSAFRHQYLLNQTKLKLALDSMQTRIADLEKEAPQTSDNPAFGRKMEREKQRWIPFRFEYLRRIALPVNCLIFMVIGCALGVQIKKGDLGVSAIAGLVAFMAFYVIDSQAKTMVFHQLISPEIGAWASAIILGVIAIGLAIRSDKG